jgi:hypothetical protein
LQKNISRRFALRKTLIFHDRRCFRCVKCT